MGLREHMNKNTTAIAVACAVVIGLVLLYVAWPRQRSVQMPVDAQDFYYDLNTKELFSAAKASVPPIDTPSGANVGVKAVVVSCGNCGKNDRQIAWLERWTREGRRNYIQYRDEMLAAGRPVTNVGMRGIEVRAEDETSWHPRESPEGRQLQDRILSMCDGKPARICDP